MVEIKKEFWNQMSRKRTKKGQLKHELRDLRDYFLYIANLQENVFKIDANILTEKEIKIKNLYL
ncbi:hypothetical protein ES706_03799 [subsurface metagenome]